ncbi:hypothetical protein J2X06_001104 [Lysobacter niastensis]|uniref:Uncharacterized protein n=1 Tax=Lysobacter niastensis TaxID=380629 RepID=A0ABU1W9E8_9GAMM|nr:hypothetical protein [Lysobacter niastensis]
MNVERPAAVGGIVRKRRAFVTSFFDRAVPSCISGEKSPGDADGELHP